MAYEARDQAQLEIQTLQGQAEKEQARTLEVVAAQWFRYGQSRGDVQAQFEAEWRELGKLIEQDRKLKEYLHQQCLAAQMQINNELAQAGKQSDDKKGKAKRGGSKKEPKEDVQSYEDAFNKIQQATGISDIDELVATFVNAEDKNFSLFNYVNELNQEARAPTIIRCDWAASCCSAPSQLWPFVPSAYGGLIRALQYCDSPSTHRHSPEVKAPRTARPVHSWLRGRWSRWRSRSRR